MGALISKILPPLVGLIAIIWIGGWLISDPRGFASFLRDIVAGINEMREGFTGPSPDDEEIFVPQGMGGF